jgi:hypothetical protein
MKHLIIIAIIALLTACSDKSPVAPVHTVDTLYISGAMPSDTMAMSGVDTGTILFATTFGSGEIWLRVDTSAVDTARKLYNLIYCQFTWGWVTLPFVGSCYDMANHATIIVSKGGPSSGGKYRLPWVRK